MRLGITLPTFEDNPAPLVARVREAERAGLHGVFCFDHLWPIGHKERPALSAYPVLGAVAALTSSIALGPLVARVGLLPDDLVVASLSSLAAISSGRLIAALGIGDEKSLAENRAFGVELRPVEDRRAALSGVIERLGPLGVECWVGATAAATIEVARQAGAVVNLWDVEDARVAAEARDGEVTWAGPLPRQADDAARRLDALRGAGASWTIWAWPSSIELVEDAAARAGIVLGTK